MELKLNGITKSFGEKKLFDKFTHTFKDNTSTLLSGESGCGKTTLLRIISGLDTDFSGTITPGRYKCSFAFQDSALFPGANIIENLLTKDRSKAGEILKMLNFSEKDFKLYPHELSGGMSKRVSLARALLYSSDLLLLDEPFAGLDGENALLAARAINIYRGGRTCIIVSHDREAIKYCTDNTLSVSRQSI